MLGPVTCRSRDLLPQEPDFLAPMAQRGSIATRNVL